MNLASAAVRRGVTFSMIFVLVIGLGLFSLARLRLDLYPDVDFPVVMVVTQYEGAGPREVEDLVTRPLEGALSSVEGAKKVSSTSKQGVSVVSVEFSWSANLNQAEIDVRKSIDIIRGVLPADADAPLVFAINPSMQPVAFLAVTGPYPETKLRQLSEEQIEPLIERVEGIALADTAGGGKREIQIQLHPRRLAAAGVTPSQVVAALRAENVQLPGGTFNQGSWEFTVQSKGRFSAVEQIGAVVVGGRQGVAVRVRDVATVKDGLKEETRLVRNNGRSGILLMVRKQSDANTVLAVRGLKRALPDIARKAGRGIQISTIFDQGDIVEKSIGNLAGTAKQAFALTVLVLLFFLRQVRPSLIVAVSIPLSLLATFSVMDALGLTLNIISLSGLALAIGMLVDNSIVVQESIFLHAEGGSEPRPAAIDGAKEVSTAITASTLTTLVVFLPILFVPGIAGRMFRDMSVTVCASLLVSLAVALTAIPLVASRLLKQRTTEKRPAGAILRRWAALLDSITTTYVSHLGWVLGNRKKTFALVTVISVAVISLATQLPTQFFAKQDMGLLQMQLEGPVGASLESTDEKFRRAERIVADHVPERQALNTDIGTGEGFVALFSKGSHSGILRLKLKDQKDRERNQAEIEDDLRQRISQIPGLSVSVFAPAFLGSQSDIAIEIYGHDLDQARDVGRSIKRLVQGIKGTADVAFSLSAGKPEYEVIYDRARLAALGLTVAGVSSNLSHLFAGKAAAVYQEGGHEYDIWVRGPKDLRSDERNLKTLPIVTPSGAVIPLSSVAVVQPAVGPATISRQDQRRVVTVTASVPGKDLGRVLAETKSGLDRFAWPPDFTYKIGGQAEDFKESFRWLGLALLVSILLVYMVMASQFESLLHPLIILFTIPLAFVGAIIALLITNTALSVTALIGFLVLGGIVVNNAIVLVDYANQLRLKGMDLLQAVLEAGRRRVRPVLMTAGTTVLGMTPLALELGEGAESWSPMARTVIGGLVVSTALTLLVIPAFYLTVETMRLRCQRESDPNRKSEA